ncbi:hypothetical protein PV325_007104 [Microctonus aethiopoides]|uniref:Uncharacterized protein n=1 Tax=Microctonus aethiopoides TaxID=144406 RepID=A0AA39C972_9HYME|nr:hypothetical protein PV325_007104 [Microctonus aethiopoides]KAK0080112.1 hypothetical protein PV326_008334 [Microctonus aethiopoides]KAK0160237.1 hypothetical protein PV328_007665 [Microctonus aethiopoides]
MSDNDNEEFEMNENPDEIENNALQEELKQMANQLETFKYYFKQIHGTDDLSQLPLEQMIMISQPNSSISSQHQRKLQNQRQIDVASSQQNQEQIDIASSKILHSSANKKISTHHTR